MNVVKCLFCGKDFELEQGCYQFCEDCTESLAKLERFLKSEFIPHIHKKWVSLIHQFEKCLKEK